MSYIRVIPRDLFNEASLLKMHAHLYIALEKFPSGKARYSEADLPRFDVVQREDDGAIYLANLELIVGAHSYRLTRPLNSRQPWPLYAEKIDDDTSDPVPVFDDSGALTVEMAALIAGT